MLAAVAVAVLVLLGEAAFEPWFVAQPQVFTYAVLLAALGVASSRPSSEPSANSTPGS